MIKLKISNGSALEFTIALLFIIAPVGILFKAVGIAVIIHCLYLWLKARKINIEKKKQSK